MTLGGLSGCPVKRHVIKEEGQPKPIITEYSVTRMNTQHTFRNSTICVSISQKPNQLPKQNKVCCKEEEEHIQIIYKTQNRDLPSSAPFSQILSHILERYQYNTATPLHTGIPPTPNLMYIYPTLNNVEEKKDCPLLVAKRHKLWSTQHVVTNVSRKLMSVSFLFSQVLHLHFKRLNAHSMTTCAWPVLIIKAFLIPA